MIRHVPAHGIAQATVILDRAAPPGGVVVALEALDPSVVTVPDEVELEEGYIGQAFPIVWAAVGVTKIRAELDGVERLLDVSAPGVLPMFRPEGSAVARSLEPDATVAGDEELRPAAGAGLNLRPGEQAATPDRAELPRPVVARVLRPTPTRAGEE